MPVILAEHEVGDLLANFRDHAFRFEIRDSYNSDVGREAFRRFMAGEPDDYLWHQGWMEMLRRDRAAGKVWQRVRIVNVPLSDWSKYAVHVARLSVQAGDDIRYLRREAAVELDLRPYDAWLLDGVRLVQLHFDDDDDSFVGAELIKDKSIVDRHISWRELAWANAQPLEEFIASAS